MTSFDTQVHQSFPAGWQTDQDFSEAFLVIAALELQARRQINSYDPFADQVFRQLPDSFRYDPFQSLVASRERIARLPLLDLVWRFADENISDLRSQYSSIPEAYRMGLSRLNGVVLGPYGASLFQAAFERRLYFGPDSELTPTEDVFSQGDPIYGANGRGVLNADGLLFMESIWPTAFRLIERRSPEYYLDSYAHRVEPVLDILERGAQRGLAGHNKWDQWPGWPEEQNSPA